MACYRPATHFFDPDQRTMGRRWLSLGTTKYFHKLGDLAALVRLIAGRNRMFHTMADMIAQQFLLHPGKRGPHGADLCDDVDAVAVFLHHAGKTAHLTFDPVQALSHRGLESVAHGVYIPPMGI